MHAHRLLHGHLHPHLSPSLYNTTLAGGPQPALSWNPLHKMRHIFITLNLGREPSASPNANVAPHMNLRTLSLLQNALATRALLWITVCQYPRYPKVPGLILRVG